MTPTDRYLLIVAVSEMVRELCEVPSGHLYAASMTKYPNLTADEFQRVVDTLKRCRLVEEKSHLLRWIGPTLPA